MPIIEQITWYTPDEKMPTNIEDENEMFLAKTEYAVYESYYCLNRFYDNRFKTSISNVKLWAYMPKGERK